MNAPVVRGGVLERTSLSAGHGFRSGTDHRFLWSALFATLFMAFYRRRLPHWIPDYKLFFVTWRLAGSLPAPAPDARDEACDRFDSKPGLASGTTDRRSGG